MISSSAVTGGNWYVQPDVRTHDYTCPNNTICYRLRQILQQYRENQFDTSNTLCFQSGVYYYDVQTVFTNLQLLQLQGQGINDMPVIICTKQSQAFTFRNITTIIINSIKFECNIARRSTLDYSRSATLYFVGCYNTAIFNMMVTPSANSSGIVIDNSRGSFTLTNYTVVMQHCNDERYAVTQYGILINFNDSTFATKNFYHLTLVQYHDEVKKTECCNYAVGIFHLMSRTPVNVTISQLNISDMVDPRLLYYYSNACSFTSSSNLSIDNSILSRNTGLTSSMFNINFDDCQLKEICISQNNLIKLSNCQITNNTGVMSRPLIAVTSTFSVYTKSQLIISNCNFNNNKNMLILKVESKNDLTWLYSNAVSISNTNITHTTFDVKKPLSLISTHHTVLSTNRLVITNVKNKKIRALQLHDSIMQIRLQNIISNNRLQYLVWLNTGSYMTFMNNSDFRVCDNNVRSLFYLDRHGNRQYSYPCIMQFFKYRYLLQHPHLYNITIKNNVEKQSVFPKRELFNVDKCDVIPGTGFDKNSYASLVETFIVNNTNEEAHDICNCDEKGDPMCKNDQLIATYPGKTVTTTFVVPNLNDTDTIIRIQFMELQSNCTLKNKNEHVQLQPNNCSEFHYTILSFDNSKCSLSLRETAVLDVTETFWIKLEQCPLGFSFNSKSNSCQCDQILRQHSLPVVSCDINNKMISRQANSWISGEERKKNDVINHVYIYKASSSCPFDYCQQHSSELQLNRPDVQCQYNRTGVACGHCPRHLSAIFGSSKCQQCSNMYLLIMIPIAVAGIVLVLLMFTLNLTVVHGTITTFILYVNIISINKTLLFPSHLFSTIPLYVMIAMANLDLGIELCFYDGMDDYAEMWLQLAFPFYLMFIAILLIVTSRYFRAVQRITAQRGLPVLATLFLLSYTKILIVTCNVLFLYTKVTTISRSAAQSTPLDHTVELVWSVDTNVTLFEGKHIILFIVNAVLLLILIPFNVILLFNRRLSKFSTIQRFKPILDPYKAPYKDEFYYWAGYQLVIRMAYLLAAGLSKDNNLTVAMLITGVLLCTHGYLHPFKHKLLNLQELLMLLNVLTVYVSTNFEQHYHQFIIRALIGVAMIYFTVVLLCRSVMLTCGKCLVKYLPEKVLKWKEKFSSSYELNEMSVEDEVWITGTYEQYREPLVAVTD